MHSRIFNKIFSYSDLNNLYDKCRDHDEARRNVEQFALAHVLEGQEEAGEHEPDVVGEVPRRLNTVVLLAPRHNVVNHEDVEKPRVLTSVTFYHLVEAWPCTAKQYQEEPQEEDHEDVEWQQSEVTLEEDTEGMSPQTSFVNFKFLEEGVAKQEAGDPVEDVNLQVGPDDPHEFKAVHPL